MKVLDTYRVQIRKHKHRLTDNAVKQQAEQLSVRLHNPNSSTQQVNNRQKDSGVLAAH